MTTDRMPIYTGEEACLACGGKGVVVGDRCRFCRGTGHCGPAAEMARLRGLLEDGTKGMAILNGEIGRLREENTDLKLVLEETQRRAAQWVNERDWWRGRAERADAERDAARTESDHYQRVAAAMADQLTAAYDQAKRERGK